MVFGKKNPGLGSDFSRNPKKTNLGNIFKLFNANYITQNAGNLKFTLVLKQLEG